MVFLRSFKRGESNSPWSSISSVVIGKEPAAPTTWSSTTTAIIGEDITLYWVHNSADNSSQTFAELEITINGETETHTIKNDRVDSEKDKTSSYTLSVTNGEGSQIKWRVRTAGVTKKYGDWSIQRTIDIYAPPTLELNIVDGDGDVVNSITTFPFYISGLAGPNTQAPIGYHLTISSNSTYETVDGAGNIKMITAGSPVYSKYYDINQPLMIEMSANNLDIENNITYTVTCVVSMNSGLTAESKCVFNVEWTSDSYSPNAEIAIDKETVVAYIRPYCRDENGVLVNNVRLSVYRREFDGGFTELAKGLSNLQNVMITDPHPSLDYARYRIVAITEDTGAVGFTDLPGYPVQNKAVVIQWDEEWSDFDPSTGGRLSEQPWSGSMLKLPYNIDVADNHEADVSLIKYIGRERPVGYYGTQRGETATWNLEIVKSDMETLYALRRLASYLGNVYVREPSGSGYWANVRVSFSQKHCELTIPVTFDITRVEGGV